MKLLPVVAVSLASLVGCSNADVAADYNSHPPPVFFTPAVVTMSAQEYADSQSKKLSDFHQQGVHAIFYRSKSDDNCMSVLAESVRTNFPQGVVAEFRYHQESVYFCYGTLLTPIEPKKPSRATRATNLSF